MRSLLVVADLGLAVSLIALTLSALRNRRMPAQMRSWLFFSTASITLLGHTAVDAFGAPPGLEDLSAILELLTVGALGVGLAFLYGADREVMRRLEGEAESDPATGLYNRPTFRAIAQRRLARPDVPRCALAVLDLDGFKQVNDRYGHPQGDRVLQLVAAALRANLRARDVAARYGGDEFVVLFDDCDARAAELVIERIRRSVHSMSEVASSAVTISAGVAGYPEAARDVDGLVAAADEALIVAKRAGKDRVLVAGRS